MGALFKLLAKLFTKKKTPVPTKPPTTPKPPKPSQTQKPKTDTKPGCERGCKTKLKIPAKKPHKRHFPCRVRTKDRQADKNTMVDPDLDIGPDIEKLNSGDFIREGNDLVVNGRRYLQEESGTLIPKSGPGFSQFSRNEHKLLGQLNSRTYDDAMKAAKNMVDGNGKKLTKEQIDKVLNMWHKCKK